MQGAGPKKKTRSHHLPCDQVVEDGEVRADGRVDRGLPFRVARGASDQRRCLAHVLRPDEARWPHRKGDLLRRMGRKDDAVVAYERAVELYANKGFIERAAATAKLMLAIDPSRADALERLEAETADALQRPLLDKSRLVHHGHRVLRRTR